MFGIGMTELLVILVIALIVFGPTRLPELAKHLGKAMREFRKATEEVKENIGLNELVNEDLSVFDEHSEDRRSESPSPPEKDGKEDGKEGECVEASAKEDVSEKAEAVPSSISESNS